MANDTPQPQGRPGRSGRPWSIILVWLAVTAPILLIQLARRDTDLQRITYSQFGQQIEQDNVGDVQIDPESRDVRGTFRRPVVLDGRPAERFRTTLPMDDPAPVVERLEANDVNIEAKSPGARWTTVLFSMLPWVFLIGFWIFLLRRMQSTPQQAMMFGKSGAKPLSPDTPRTTFADVAGADEAKAELQELIDFLRDPSKFQRLGGRLPKGVLLVGPPGTGKTLLARAVAGEAGRPFFSMSGSDFVEMFVGVGAARIRDLFTQGRAHAPCIIFIDELDAVGRQRGAGLGGGHDEREQTLNQLLVELDGFDTKEGVILLSATNRPDVLDPALLRPGRFDRQVVVDLPDVAAREKILSVHARKIPLHGSVDLAIIARGTPGLSGADLANIANEAALLAARRNKERVDLTDFEDAKDKVMLGVERRSMILTEEDKRLLAYHESGHALVNLLIPNLDPVHKVTIVPRGRALGVTFSLPEIDRRNLSREYLLGKLAVAYGGRVAEEVVFGPEQVTTGASMDYRQATDMARRMVTEFGMSDQIGPISVAGEDEVFLGRDFVRRREISEHTAQLIDREVDRVTRMAYHRAKDLVEANLDLLHDLAAALMESETLDRQRIEAILERRVAPPPPSPRGQPINA